MNKELEKKLYDLALKESEYNLIIDKINRRPNDLELGLFGSLWSEHCGYQHSKPLLKKFKIYQFKYFSRGRISKCRSSRYRWRVGCSFQNRIS